MLKPTPSKPGLFSVAFKRLYALKSIAVVALASLVLAVLYLVSVTPLTAVAATNNTINFQARLEDASGAIVPDGNYNVEFKLYNVSSAGTAEWTEDYLNSASQGVHVANGYLTVNLGSITPFPSTIDWDQQQWMTMNIGGTTTGSVTWDGEMNPRLQLTAVPYALRAGSLASPVNTSGYQSTLSMLQPANSVTGNEVFQIPDMGAAGTYTLMTTATGVQLQPSTPGTAQTGNFNISGTGIVNTLNATSINVNTTTPQGVLTVEGTTSDSTALGLVVNDANGDNLLQVRNDGQITLGRASGANSTIGKTDIGTHPDSGYSSLVSADKITTGPVNATLSSITTYVGSPIDTTHDNYYVGIYSDNSGTPGTLLATSAQGTLTAGAWNTLPVSASLSANTSYWLAFFTNTTVGTDPYQYYDTTATVNHAYMTGVSYAGGLPSTFTASGTSTAMHSIYASVSETGSLGTTLTINPTTGATLMTPTNTTTAFQVQNSSSTPILVTDTTNGRVGIDGGSPTATLQVKNSSSNATILDVQNSSSFDTLTVADTGKVSLGKAPAAVLGNGAIGVGGGSDFGLETAQKFTTGISGGGAISSMSVYIHSGVSASPNNLGQLAIYADTTSGCALSAADCPSTLIASSSQTALTANSWNTMNVSATLSANTTYWLAFWENDPTQSEEALVTPTNAGTPFVFGSATWGASIPSTFPTMTFDNTGYDASIYASYASNGSAIIADTASNTVQLGYNTTLALQGSSAYIQNSQGFTGSESLGLSASVSDAKALALGDTSNSAYEGVAVGYAASAYQSGTAVGYGAWTSGAGAVALGWGANANTNGTALGVSAAASTDSIAIGTQAATTASNQLVIGSAHSSGFYIQDAYVGSGVTDSAPQSVTLHATGGSGSNVTGANLNLASGIGTGSGNGGNITFQVSNPGSSGSSANTLNTVGTISGVNGAVTLENSANSTNAFQVQNATGYSILNLDTTRALVTISGNGSSSAAGPSYVNNWTGGGTNLTTLSVSPATAGDLLTLAIETPNTTITVTSVTGGGVANWSKVTTNNGSAHEEIWQGTVTSTGASTVTITFSSTPGFNVDLDSTEFTAGLGAATNWSVTASGSISNGSSTTLTYPSLTATQANSLYWGYGRSSASALAGSTSGFSYVPTASSNMVTYDATLSSGTMYSPTAVNSPAATSDGIGMIIVNSVGGGGLNDSGALTVSGSSTFNNSVVVNSGSSSAFQIQNASGATLFNADTTNMQITTDNLSVGSATSLNAAGRIFSDGFESGNFNTWTTGLQSSGSSTATIDTSTVHNGKYAVKFNETGSVGSDAYLQSTFSSTATSYSVRSYVNFAGLPAANLNLFRIYSSVSGDIQAVFIDNTGKLGVTNNGTGLGSNGTALSTGAWHEVEMRVTLGTGTSGSISIYLDGVDQHDYTGLTTYDGTNLDNRFRLGEVVNNAGTFWADDFVIDSGTNGTGLAANANVAGSLHVSGNSSFGGSALLQTNANTTQALLVQNASSTAVFDVDTANNRVGIGTATPSSIFDVETNSNTVTAPQITLNQSGSGDASIALQSAAQPWYIGVSSANSSNFAITSANADKSSSTFGDTTAESNSDNSGSGYQVCSQYTPGGSGSEFVSSMSVYIGSAADVAPNNLYQVAIYTDSSGPSTLVAHSASAAVTGNSWNTVTVNATITGGTPYWLCYQKNASTGSLSEITRNLSGTGAYNTAGSQTFGTWSATFPAHSSDFDGYAIYATYSQNGAYNTFGTNLMSLSTIGQATFQNSTNSTAAFQVQNATGVSLFGVNTSGSTVNIGSVGSTVLASVVNIASSSGAAQTVTLGSTNGASSTTIQGGSGGIIIGSSSTANSVVTQAQGITNTMTGSATAPSDIIKTTTNSATAFQVQNSSTQALLTVDTANNALVLGNDITPIALTVRGGAATGNNIGGSNITFQASNGTGAGGSGSFIFQTGKPSGNAVGVDNTGEVLITTGTTLSMSYTTGSQSSRLMVVQLVTLAGRSFTGVTYNGVAMTKLTTKTSGSVYEEVWYLVNPASGTNSLVATENTSGEASMEAATFYNVDQTTPLGTSATASGSTTGTQPSSLNVSTSTSAQLVIDDIAIDTSTAGSLTNGTGQTQLWDYVAGSGAYISGSAYKSGTGGTVNMSWNVNSADWADIGVPINPTSNSTTDSMNTSLVINNAGNVGVDNSNPQYSLDVAGTQRIQTTTNSTTAFQVQNSGGANLFTVDTSDNVVQIGSATSDSTAILLQLDRYTQVNDPPGTNGAMYYNTTLGRFRCYQDGWYDCIGISGDYQRQHPFYSTDFFGASTPAQVAPWYGGALGTSGSWAVSDSYNTPSHPGTVKITAGATSGGYSIMSTQSSANTSGIMLGGGQTYELVFYVPSLSGDTIRLGFWDGTDSTTAVANGTYMEINSSGVATGKQTKASTTSSTGSTYTISTGTWYRAKVVVNSAGNGTDYYIYNDSGTQLWHDSLGSTNFPASTTPLNNGVAAESTTSNVNVAVLDYMAFWEADQLTR